VFLVIILIAEICAGVLLYFQKGTLENLIGKISVPGTEHFARVLLCFLKGTLENLLGKILIPS